MQQQRQRWTKEKETDQTLVGAGNDVDQNLASAAN